MHHFLKSGPKTKTDIICCFCSEKQKLVQRKPGASLLHQFGFVKWCSRKHAKRLRMALINCKECGEKVSKNAKSCPGCGAPVKGRASLAMVIMALIALLFFLGKVYGTN